MDVARKVGLEGLFGEGVSFHTHSQKVGYACGFRDCVIALRVIPSDVVFKGIMDSVPQRGSVVYSFLPLVPQKPATLYAPSRHLAFIESIYRNLGLDVRFAMIEKGKSHDMEERCIIKTELLPVDNRAEVEIVRYGADVLDETTNIMKDLLRRRVDQISLYLDLEHPMTVHFCGEFEKLGFFIAGVIPMLHFNHTLILQYLNNISLNYSLIQLHSEFARTMLDYVRERDSNT